VTRKEFLRLAAGPAALSAMPGGAQMPAKSPVGFSLSNPVFRFVAKRAPTPEHGLTIELIHLPSGIVLAQGPYSYGIGTPYFAHAQGQDDSWIFTGDFGNGVALEQIFTAPAKGDWLEERLKLTNTSSHPIAIPFRCGFVLPIGPDTLKNYVFTAVPYRREPTGGRSQYADYTLDQVLHSRRRSRLRSLPDLNTDVARKSQQQMFTDDYISEAWALTDGKQGFLISKYNQAGRDFALLDTVPVAGDKPGLRWGGAGQPLTNVEGLYRLAPGETYDFGVTRLTPFTGDLTQGFYTYRAETESRGHALPKNYDPPSHWNELYDNKLWWTGDSVNPDLRKKFYTLADMKEAAAKAQDMGCEALYCDPGWDTPQSSKIWGAERLGPLPDFLALLKDNYGGLKLSLHTPLSAWTGANADLPPGTPMIGEDGGTSNRPCGASNQYVDVTVKRLGDLAAAGVAFFMFDGTVYIGECFAKDHGHALPSTTAEYVDMTNKIAYDIHKDHPDVLIEMHDQLFGGVSLRYVPSYYGQGLGVPGKHGWDEIWAFELMWSPMGDLVGGHSIALYYFNLAYSIPLYIHIDLRQDNAQCLMLWWNISTCRHLGVGGTHADPAVRAAQKQTIATYRRLKPYFCRGTFYGIDEVTHVHVHPDKTGAVINCFNLEDHPVERVVLFQLSRYGLSNKAARTFSVPGFAASGDSYAGKVAIPAFGHALVEVT
jgi:hypothetical protein